MDINTTQTNEIGACLFVDKNVTIDRNLHLSSSSNKLNATDVFTNSRDLLLETQDKAQKQISDLQEQVSFLKAQLEQERIAQMEAIKAIVQEAVIPLRDENAQLRSTVAILDEKVTLWLAEREAKKQRIEEEYLNEIASIESNSNLITVPQKQLLLSDAGDRKIDRLRFV